MGHEGGDELERLLVRQEAVAEQMQAAAKALAAAANRPVPVGRWYERWVDLKAIIPALGGAAFMLFVGWLAWRDDIRQLKSDRDTMKASISSLADVVESRGPKIQDAINSGAQNAGEIRRVEADSRDRDKSLSDEMKARFAEHMQYQHGGRRSAVRLAPAWPLPIWPANGGGW